MALPTFEAGLEPSGCRCGGGLSGSNPKEIGQKLAMIHRRVSTTQRELANWVCQAEIHNR